MTGRPAQPIPADFTTWAPGKTNREVEERYGISQRTAIRWRKETGIVGYVHKPGNYTFPTRRLPMPEDFAERAAVTSDRQLARELGRDWKTIKKWRDILGIPTLRARKAAVSQPVAPTPKPALRRVHGAVALPARSLQRAPQLAGHDAEAAQHLRRFYSPVYRCTETGRQDPKGSCWRIGNAVVSAAELVERAGRKGWRADAWRELAA